MHYLIIDEKKSKFEKLFGRKRKLKKTRKQMNSANMCQIRWFDNLKKKTQLKTKYFTVAIMISK